MDKNNKFSDNKCVITDYKYALAEMFNEIIPLIDIVNNTYDLDWAETMYNIPDLKKRMLQLKRNMERYIHKYIENRDDEELSEKAIEEVYEGNNMNIDNIVFYNTIETEIYRQKKQLEKEILSEIMNLSHFLSL